MGTYGYKIFQDDYALDVRERYLELLLDGLSNEEVTSKMIYENQFADSDESPIFWLSLAATQWEYGRLTEVVKAGAINVIDSDADWGKDLRDKKRIKELAQLRAKLGSEQPKEKRLVRRRTNTKSGDFFRFRLDAESYAFGRVLNDGYIAIYLHRSKTGIDAISEIMQMKIAFVLGTTSDGFYNRKWKVIGWSALEDFFLEPIHFFHQSTGSDKCLVFNLWDSSETFKTMNESDCKEINWGRFGIEQWGSYSSVHIVRRLIAKLEKRRYNFWLPDDWEYLNFRKSMIE